MKITIDRQKLERVLDALEDADKHHGLVYIEEVVDIKEALAQPAQEQRQEDIIRMARESGMAGFDGTVHAMFQLEAFAALVAAAARAAEREEVIAEFIKSGAVSEDGTIVAAIRAREQA
jgi:hypothetical protein